MSLRDDIQKAQIAAMKARDSERLSVFRMLVSALKNEEIQKKDALTDEEVQAVVKRQVKQLKDALGDFEKSDREDLVENTKKELAVLSEYLPEELSDEALEKIVTEVITNLGDSPNMGQVMGSVMKEVKGKADGNRVRTMVSKKLGQ